LSLRGRAIAANTASFTKTTHTPHQVDHIVSQKHGGSSEPENLAWACIRCNAWKGSDVGSVDHETGAIVALFNPRRHRWQEHFALRDYRIEPLTPIGSVTVRLLRLNSDQRIAERHVLG
jgi:hypothetical protein